MKTLKFYIDEATRHPWPASVGVNNDRDRVARALKQLSREFGLKPIKLEWRGETISYAYPIGRTISLAAECNWLVFAHELAHLIEYRRHLETRHGRRMAGLVDEVIASLERSGWIRASLDAQALQMVG